jgi:predicted nucleotidyltransferase
MGMNINDNKLTTFLFSNTRRALLTLIYGRHDEKFYVNQLMQLTGSGSGAVQRELKLMTEAGVVNRTESGNMVHYQANKLCPVYDELKSFVQKTSGAADIIRKSLLPVSRKIQVAFIFGSIATGTERKSSDIDLMVVGDVTFGETITLLSSTEENLGRELNTIVYPAAEFQQKVKEDHYFLKNVIDQAKIFIIGDESELNRLVE